MADERYIEFDQQAPTNRNFRFWKNTSSMFEGRVGSRYRAVSERGQDLSRRQAFPGAPTVDSGPSVAKVGTTLSIIKNIRAMKKEDLVDREPMFSS